MATAYKWPTALAVAHRRVVKIIQFGILGRSIGLCSLGNIQWIHY